MRKVFVNTLSERMALSKPRKLVQISRPNIFDEAINLYTTQLRLVNHFPILVEFKDEEGADFGGIMRDFFQPSGKRPTRDFLMVQPSSRQFPVQMLI